LNSFSVGVTPPREQSEPLVDWGQQPVFDIESGVFPSDETPIVAKQMIPITVKHAKSIDDAKHVKKQDIEDNEKISKTEKEPLRQKLIELEVKHEQLIQEDPCSISCSSLSNSKSEEVTDMSSLSPLFPLKLPGLGGGYSGELYGLSDNDSDIISSLSIISNLSSSDISVMIDNAVLSIYS
jgi:hypothetical protein